MLKLSILAVDDSPVITEMIKDAFEKEGYSVLIASDGAEALRIALQEHPDLIIADIAMPGMDGWELCSQIRSNPFTSFIPFIFLTAKTEVPDRIKGLQMGADDYLTKPFEMEELLARVQLIFQRIRKTQESMLTKESAGLSGSTSEMALPDLLQMFGLNQKTGVLKISRVGYPSGAISLRTGKIISARLGSMSGGKALFRLLGWQDASFEVAPLMDPGGKSDIDISVEEALMEGMRQMDELKELDNKYNLYGKKLAVKDQSSASELGPGGQQLLQAIKENNDFNTIMNSLPWTDLEIYKTAVRLMESGALQAA